MMRTRSAADLSICDVDLRTLSDADIAALNAFENTMKGESHPEDPPTPLEVTRDEVRTIPDIVDVRERWAREGDGCIAGQAWTYFKKAEDNRHLLYAAVNVRHDRRRQGIARMLLPWILEVAVATGRTTLMGWTSDRVPAGGAFTERLGAEVGSALHTNRLVLGDVDRNLVACWISEGPVRAPDYSLFVVDQTYPEELLDEIIDLIHVMNTAPRDDLDMDDFVMTRDELREYEKSWKGRGVEMWTLYARHEPTGRLVGFTEVFYDPKEPDTVWQGDTGVRPEHRGHALGKWLKASMLDRILRDRPQAKDVRTQNADTNDAMLGINRALGFDPFEARSMWQVSADRVRECLG